MTHCEQPENTDTRPAILVIDDELGPRESLRFLLKDEYRVMCAASVEQGLQLLQEQKPDTVIMDIRMPGRNGIDGLRAIRALDSELAVIMLTGFAAVGTAQEAIRHEASDYMEKPFDAAVMRLTVRRHIEQTRLRRKRFKLLSEADALEQHIHELQGKDLLAELGQSSSEFVHDLRNALTVSTGSLSLLRMEMEERQHLQTRTPSEANRYLEMLESSMQRCVAMLDTWQRLIRQAPQQLTRFRVHAFVCECLASCQPAELTSLARITMTCETIGEDIDLLGDRVQLTRVLANLIQNALHAVSADKGVIRVRSEIDDTSIRISVSDNGCGISEENLKHVFSSNFTTRQKLGGMGLGLFIAQKVAQAHGGNVTVESKVNQGSTFTLRLPRTPDVTGNDAV